MVQQTTNDTEISAKIQLASKQVAGALIVIEGAFLLLCSCGILPYNYLIVLCPSLLLCIGLILFIVGLIQVNTVSVWCSLLFITPAIIILLADFTSLRYGQMYPLFILAPAVASVFTLIISRDFMFHLKIIILFGVVCTILLFNSFGLINWAITVPILIVVLGLIICYISIISRDSEEDDND